jgi:fused signal recognition particle receptor
MSFFKNLKNKFKKTSVSVEENLKQNRLENERNKINDSSTKSYLEIAAKSGSKFNNDLALALKKSVQIDDKLFEELLEVLIAADLGYEMATKIIESTKNAVKIQNVSDKDLIKKLLTEEMFATYLNSKMLNLDLNIEENRVNVIVVVGVNGVGKTTTIGKMANLFKNKLNKKVLIVAGDTFRAAASEQLKV